MYRSKKSLGKQSQCNAQANPPQDNATQMIPPPNPPSYNFQSHFSTNALLGSSSRPNPQTTNFHNRSLSPTPFLDSFGSSLNHSPFQSFTSLLQPALSNQSTPLLPMYNSSLPVSIPSTSPEPPSPNADLFDHELDAYENKLLEEVEIVDDSGNIIRMEKMSLKDVHKLKAGEKIMVHVDELYQPIKAAGGLCTRFMTVLLRQPSLCSLDAKTFREVKKYSGADLVAELRSNFSLPCNSEMDKVILSKFSSKYRSVKWRLKEKLLNIAKEKIKENRKNEGLYVEDEEKEYTSEQILGGLDIIEMPFCFMNHQWQKFKDNIRDDHAKELSRKGKEARKTQVHTHTTGSVSYARKKDMIKLEKKRKPTEVEFFEITHQRKNGSFVQKESKELMDKVNEMVKQKMSDLGIYGSLDPKLQSEIHSEVWKELMEDDNARKPIGYGVGVTKSQVSKLSADLRRIRDDISGTNEVHALRKRVSLQDKRVSLQDNQINELKKTVNNLLSHIQNSASACGTNANMIMDPTLLAGIGLPESQGRMVDHDSNNETDIPSPNIPSP